MSERILGKHSAELDEQGRLILYGPGTRLTLPYDEAYQLLVFLYDQRDMLYQLVHDDTDEGHQQRNDERFERA
jgi:hypothetical protein